MTGAIIRQQHGRVWSNVVPQPPRKCIIAQDIRSGQIRDIALGFLDLVPQAGEAA